MNTLREVKQQIASEPQWWCIHLMDFVDDFRYYKDPRALVEPFEMSEPKVRRALGVNG